MPARRKMTEQSIHDVATDQDWAAGDEAPARFDDARTGGYDDRRAGYDEHQGGYDDRRGGYDDRRSGYDDRRGGYGDRRGGYEDRRGGYDDRRGGYDDRRGGYDDRRGGGRRGGFEERRGGYHDRPREPRRETTPDDIPMEGPFKLRVANVSYDADEQTLGNFIYQDGKIGLESLEMARRGTFYAIFATREDAVAALDLNGAELMGRSIFFSVPRTDPTRSDWRSAPRADFSQIRDRSGDRGDFRDRRGGRGGGRGRYGDRDRDRDGFRRSYGGRGDRESFGAPRRDYGETPAAFGSAAPSRPQRRVDPFGAARPKEVVRQERGEEVQTIEAVSLQPKRAMPKVDPKELERAQRVSNQFASLSTEVERVDEDTQ